MVLAIVAAYLFGLLNNRLLDQAKWSIRASNVIRRHYGWKSKKEREAYEILRCKLIASQTTVIEQAHQLHEPPH